MVAAIVTASHHGLGPPADPERPSNADGLAGQRIRRRENLRPVPRLHVRRARRQRRGSERAAAVDQTPWPPRGRVAADDRGCADRLFRLEDDRYGRVERTRRRVPLAPADDATVAKTARARVRTRADPHMTDPATRGGRHAPEALQGTGAIETESARAHDEPRECIADIRDDNGWVRCARRARRRHVAVQRRPRVPQLQRARSWDAEERVATGAPAPDSLHGAQACEEVAQP